MDVEGQKEIGVKIIAAGVLICTVDLVVFPVVASNVSCSMWAMVEIVAFWFGLLGMEFMVVGALVHHSHGES